MSGAKTDGMLTLSTFALMVGSVAMSVLWACKDESPTQS
jgi:hypothetical protein